LRYMLRSFKDVTIKPLGNRFSVAYDLTIGWLPLVGWALNNLAGAIRGQNSGRCPAGYVAIATK